MKYKGGIYKIKRNEQIDRTKMLALERNRGGKYSRLLNKLTAFLSKLVPRVALENVTLPPSQKKEYIKIASEAVRPLVFIIQRIIFGNSLYNYIQ